MTILTRFVHVHTCAYVCMCVHVCMGACVYECMSVCVYGGTLVSEPGEGVVWPVSPPPDPH